MAAQSHYIDHRHSRIHYLRMGSGPGWLFCFHGYGESAHSFHLLEAALGGRFTIIAIDMPFHGGTVWNDGLLFTPQELVTIIHTIKPAAAPMTLLGYSMGGRVAMQLLQLIPGEIQQLVLVAPDGLHNNRWQWLVTKTAVGNRLFRELMYHPHRALKLVNWGMKTGLYNKNLRKFVHYYLSDAAQCKALYRRWTTMRKFSPAKALLRSTIAKYQLPVRILFGQYDPVILAKHGIAFAAGYEALIAVRSIPAGHQLLKEKYIHELVKMVDPPAMSF